MSSNTKKRDHSLKIIRRFEEDIWGVLAVTDKPSNVLNYIYEAYQNNFKYKKLLQNKAIIRNKLKINSAINNAKQFIKIQQEFGSFDEYLWGFVNHKPIKNKFKKYSDLACSSIISEKLSQDLKKHGFTFVGPIICYSLMQAVGMVNDHTSDCFKYAK